MFYYNNFYSHMFFFLKKDKKNPQKTPKKPGSTWMCEELYKRTNFNPNMLQAYSTLTYLLYNNVIIQGVFQLQAVKFTKLVHIERCVCHQNVSGINISQEIT